MPCDAAEWGPGLVAQLATAGRDGAARDAGRRAPRWLARSAPLVLARPCPPWRAAVLAAVLAWGLGSALLALM